ncbi:DSBA-like thioredoxin domain protein [mine drainage metagenome]|uniref:DSBA-like thioredoxin domain protein n=1 Tax=mine drainage metagenome TaxID=410659 RepID=A0A1J5T2I1_9ZZZZ
MSKPHLVYFADPMCSWCWGFSPVIEAIQQRYGPALPIRLIVGGLRPWTTAPITAHERADIRQHWEHVRDASGQPFDFTFFDRAGFVYDTEPASRAIVVLRRRGRETGLAALRRIQRAFYAENRDVTDTGTLTALAVELGMEAKAFRNDFESEAAAAETRADFAIAQSAGVRGFPTLITGKGRDGRHALVTHGFQPGAQILPALAQWLGTAAGEGTRPDEEDSVDF